MSGEGLSPSAREPNAIGDVMSAAAISQGSEAQGQPGGPLDHESRMSLQPYGDILRRAGDRAMQGAGITQSMDHVRSGGTHDGSGLSRRALRFAHRHVSHPGLN
jgi:hypothetical protein